MSMRFKPIYRQGRNKKSATGRGRAEVAGHNGQRASLAAQMSIS